VPERRKPSPTPRQPSMGSSACPPSRKRLDRLTELTVKEAARGCCGSLVRCLGAGDGTRGAHRKARPAGRRSSFTPELWEKQADEPTADPAWRSRFAGRDPMAVRTCCACAAWRPRPFADPARLQPPYTGTAVSRLFDAGRDAWCDELRRVRDGSSTENSGYPPRTTRGISIGCPRQLGAAPRGVAARQCDRLGRLPRVDTTARGAV